MQADNGRQRGRQPGRAEIEGTWRPGLVRRRGWGLNRREHHDGRVLQHIQVVAVLIVVILTLALALAFSLTPLLWLLLLSRSVLLLSENRCRRRCRGRTGGCRSGELSAATAVTTIAIAVVAWYRRWKRVRRRRPSGGRIAVEVWWSASANPTSAPSEQATVVV